VGIPNRKEGSGLSLHGKIVKAQSLSEKETNTMYALMETYYDDMTQDAFLRDLNEKDYCILLLDASGAVKGFSTQKMIHVETGSETVSGVFSGDTIIHKEDWGSMELYKTFARNLLEIGRQYNVFYWFLISKGYKTYKILPLFFNEFYPRYRIKTPDHEQVIMHAFGSSRYPGEYDSASGVIAYKGVKDKLKLGVADIGEKHLRDEHIAFFLQANPGYFKGNDLVCLARLDEGNLNRTAHRLLLGNR
jgi:hypothetical protein